MSKRKQQSDRWKSPSRLVRDKAFGLWVAGADSTSPVEKKYPPHMAAILIERTGASRKRVYAWLRDPDGHPLEWGELVAVAAELGLYLRVLCTQSR